MMEEEIQREEEDIRAKTKLAWSEVKSLRAEKKTMSSPSALADAAKKYGALRDRTETTIRKTKSHLCEWVKRLRKQKAIALLNSLFDEKPSALPPECVFVSKFVPRSRFQIHRERMEYAASCVRVGGEYAVAMQRRRRDDAADRFNEDGVFPLLESRNEFVIDGSYPLTGFEDDMYGNTHAVFLTGLALAAAPDSDAIIVKGCRVAKVPVLTLFDAPDTITATEFIKDKENSVFEPLSQPMEEDAHKRLSEALEAERAKLSAAREAPQVEPKVYVYEGEKSLLFALAASQVDGGWCNPNSCRSTRSGGFSGEKGEMNDVCCFSDCIDVCVNALEEEEGKISCCVTIEPGRKLSEATPAPDAARWCDPKSPRKGKFSAQDVLDKLIDWSNKSRSSEMEKNPWWCSSSPPLKVEQIEEETAAERCAETEAAVQTPCMIDRLILEPELKPVLRNILGKPPGSYCHTETKLKRRLQELEENAVRHGGDVWSERSIKVARALLMDEAYATSAAQQLTIRIINSGIFEGMCVPRDNSQAYRGQRKFVSGSRMVNVSPMKNDTERDIDAALKDWVESELSSGKRKRGRAPEAAEPRKKIKDIGGGIIPPSFVTTPKMNMKRLAEDMADLFGRSLCGMKNAADAYQNVCSAAADLKERLLLEPFSIFDQLPALLENTEHIVEEQQDLLQQESERLGKLLNAMEHQSLYQAFLEAFEKSCSWNDKDDEAATKTVLIATALRRMREEYHAYKILVNVLIIDRLRKEGGDSAGACKNPLLAAVLKWYITLVIRNRICDAFRHIAKAKENDTSSYGRFLWNMTNNHIVMSFLTTRIIESLRVPATTLAAAATAKFVFPSVQIIGGDAAAKKRSVKFPPHVIGPVLIDADFRPIELDVKHIKMFINTITGNGLLTACPDYETDFVILGKGEKNIASTHSIVAQDWLSDKKILPTTSLAAAAVVVAPSEGGNASSLIATSLPWTRDRLEESRNIWRCGFVVPKRLCGFIFRNRKSVKIKAWPHKNAKMTSLRLAQNPEKVCRAIGAFTKGSRKILSRNLAASGLTKIQLEMEGKEARDVFATCLTFWSRDLVGPFFGFHSVFLKFHKWDGGETSGEEERQHAGVLRSAKKSLRRLHDLKKKHVSCLKRFE